MMSKANHFVWTDLSSYHPQESIQFYKELFNWQFHNESGYHLMTSDKMGILGIYETPEFFKKINMPHFWMNYIQVDNLQETLTKAKALLAIIEIENIEFFNGKIALIRDTMGAGFTVYQGTGLNSLNDQNGIIKNRELHSSDINKSKSFYQKLFGWVISQNAQGIFEAYDLDGIKIANMMELSNDIKGKYEYWVTEFNVENLSSFKEKLSSLGGSVISDEGYRLLVTDQFSQAFFYVSS